MNGGRREGVPLQGTEMTINVQRPNRRPKLFLPAFLSAPHGETRDALSRSPFPLSIPELRRAVADRVD
jgi:hypothetical protein